MPASVSRLPAPSASLPPVLLSVFHAHELIELISARANHHPNDVTRQCVDVMLLLSLRMSPVSSTPFWYLTPAKVRLDASGDLRHTRPWASPDSWTVRWLTTGTSPTSTIRRRHVWSDRTVRQPSAASASCIHAPARYPTGHLLLRSTGPFAAPRVSEGGRGSTGLWSPHANLFWRYAAENWSSSSPSSPNIPHWPA